ncbi:MAG: hypothetical protein KDD52_03605 [Bdellovibrionales bacterium]|nr:hypothetical protein [Bdellovibrionales bacterium]
MRKTQSQKKYRLSVIVSLFMIMFVCLSVRSIQLQVLSDPRVHDLQKRQEFRNVKFTSPRGMIFDRFGRALSVSIETPSIFLDPSMIQISSLQKRELSKILGISTKIIDSKIKNTDRKFAWLARKISPQKEKKIRELEIGGLHIISEWDRMYPDREILAQTLGFVGTDGDGLEGLERQYDQFLKTQALLVRSKRDAKGRSIFSGHQLQFEAEKALHLDLTIDSTIQYLLERELQKASTKHHVESGMGLVMNPYTGELLAMASYPSANPNRLSDFSPADWKNRPIQTSFEPGSIFKVFVMAGALEQNAVSPGDLFHCEEGSLRFGSKVIRNPIEKSWLDPKGILKYSNNVGMARIGLDLGQERLISIIESFGFTQATAIDFPGEQSGYLDTSHRWVPTKIANISFGQGIAVTLIQVARALSAIANGGYLVRPYVVSSARTSTGKEIFSHHPSLKKRKILSDSTLALMKKWMEAVTEKDGTGHHGKLEGYRTAGKTGTAQIYDQTLGEYSSTKVVSSFIGFAPVTKPELVTVITFYSPRDSEYGGTIAAPVFKKVMESSLSYLGVPDDQEKESKMERMQLALSSLKEKQIEEDRQGERLSFQGLSAREVIRVAKAHDLEFTMTGRGYVREEVFDGKVWQLYLSPKEHL